MSTILEQIIRHTLLEQRTVAKIKQISAQEEAIARSKGAVQSYAVLVKGTNNSFDIANLVLGATLASTGAETENVEPVGRRSKYATNDYVYVMSNPNLSLKRQRILVYILPNPFKNYITARIEDNKPVQISQLGVIGDAALMTLDDYNTNLDVIKSLNQKLDIDVTNEPDNILKSKEQTFVYFPDGYTAKTKQGKEFKVYTLNDEDKYVYIIIDNSYQKTLKSDFEEKWVNGIEVSNEPVTDADTIEKLNKITKQNIPVTTPVTPEKETAPADTKKETPPEEKKKETKPEEKKKDKEKEEKKKETKPEEIKFVKDKKYILKPTNVYVYENKNFKKVGAVSDNTAATYISTASDKEYIKIKLKEGEFYVKKSAVKY